jgi:type IV pilus assembly protein PilZ
MEEQRARPRIVTNIEIVFREAGAFVKSYMLNVNNGGIFVKSDHPLPLDTVIGMRMQLPNDKEKMNLEGRVVWSNTKAKSFPAGMGIQFINIAPEHKDKISAFVEANLSEIKKRALF